MPSESKEPKDEKAGEKPHAATSSECKAHSGHEKAGAKDDDGSSCAADDNDLVNKVISFFFDNDEFAHTFETFAEHHCHAFDLDSDEMKLEYTDIYNEFLALLKRN
ncbi:The ARF-like 2 binding protein BART [Phytophthora infestans]|uniref:The ARF-like 2 binding protein BART n=1 Tax=Phytophthora infestans TaxID=4787 RepID=A0A833SIS1_PHYIN|nr:The ARF-like 2 binding protein BART [Phytophthora infestans]